MDEEKRVNSRPIGKIIYIILLLAWPLISIYLMNFIELRVGFYVSRNFDATLGMIFIAANAMGFGIYNVYVIFNFKKYIKEKWTAIVLALSLIGCVGGFFIFEPVMRTLIYDRLPLVITVLVSLFFVWLFCRKK